MGNCRDKQSRVETLARPATLGTPFLVECSFAVIGGGLPGGADVDCDRLRAESRELKGVGIKTVPLHTSGPSSTDLAKFSSF